MCYMGLGGVQNFTTLGEWQWRSVVALDAAREKSHPERDVPMVTGPVTPNDDMSFGADIPFAQLGETSATHQQEGEPNTVAATALRAEDGGDLTGRGLCAQDPEEAHPPEATDADEQRQYEP